MTCFEDDAVAVAGLGHFLVRPRVFVLRFDCRLLKLRSCGEDAFFFFSNMAMRSRIEGLAIVLRRDVANLCQGSAPHQREVLGRARASTSESGWLLGMLVRKASAIFGARIHLQLAPERIRHAMRAHFYPGPREH